VVSYPNGQLDPEEYSLQRERDLQREVERAEEAVGKLTVNLTKKHKDFINFVEHYSYANHSYPSVAALKQWSVEADIPFVEARQIELDVIAYLRHRGLEPSKANSRLSDEQLAAANLILNYTDRRSKANKLKVLGITSTQWDGWLNNKTFKDYLANRTGELLDKNVDVAHSGLLAAVERGESAALKLYYEITGIHRADSPQANINVIMALLLEVIQREIRDEDLLRRIASGFELVMLRQAAALSPTATPGTIDGVYAGHHQVIEARDAALNDSNVQVVRQNPRSQGAPTALDF
jgi:hypothetical protein